MLSACEIFMGRLTPYSRRHRSRSKRAGKGRPLKGIILRRLLFPATFLKRFQTHFDHHIPTIIRRFSRESKFKSGHIRSMLCIKVGSLFPLFSRLFRRTYRNSLDFFDMMLRIVMDKGLKMNNFFSKDYKIMVDRF